MNLFRNVLCSAALLLPLAAGAMDSHWLRTLGGPEGDMAMAAAELDGMIYYAGTTDVGGVSGLDRTGLLFGVGPDGAVQLQILLTDPDDTPVVISGLSAGDGVLYASGSLGNHPDSAGAVLLALEPDGSIRWQRVLTGAREAFGTNVLATADGGALVVGATLEDDPGAFVGDGLAVKYDADGDMVWQTRIGTLGFDFFNDAAQRKDGGYILVGGVGTRTNPNFDLNGWIVSLDSAGNLEWQTGLVIESGDMFTSVVLTRKQIWAFGRECGNCFAGGGEGWFVRTDYDGNFISSELIGDFELAGPADFIHSAVKAAKGPGAYLIGSTDSSSGISREIFVAKLSGKGKLSWVKRIGTDTFDEGRALAATSSGIAIGGFRSTAAVAQEVLIGTMDKQGRALGDCAEVTDLPAEIRLDTFDQTQPAPELGSVLASSLVSSAGTLIADTNSPLPNDAMLCMD